MRVQLGEALHGRRLAALCSLLQGGVHPAKAFMGLCKAAAEQRHEQAVELLALNESTAAVPRLYTKGVLPVEEAGNEEAAEPAELTIGCHLAYGRLERHAPAAGRLDPDLEPFALAEGSADSSDERIPLRIRGEVGENFPDPLRRGVDV